MFLASEKNKGTTEKISQEIMSFIQRKLQEPQIESLDIIPSYHMLSAMAFRATLSEDFGLNTFRLRKWLDQAIATNQELTSFQIDQWIYYIEAENRDIFLDRFNHKLEELEIYWQKWQKWQN